MTTDEERTESSRCKHCGMLFIANSKTRAVSQRRVHEAFCDE